MNYYRAKAESNTRHTINSWKGNWIGHICFLKHIIEGKIEGRGGRGRRQSSHGMTFMEERKYGELKEETLNRKHYGELALGETMNQSKDRLRDDDDPLQRTVTLKFS